MHLHGAENLEAAQRPTLFFLFITRKPVPFYPWLLIAGISWGYREQQQVGVDWNAKTDPRSDSEE